jgi:Bifunctional DNA primase/polymerase, N-terminal
MNTKLPKLFRVRSTNDQQAILGQVSEAAEAAVRRGWHVFPCIYAGKKPFKGTRGSLDARCDDLALTKWKSGFPANPAVRLDKSGLTVLDIDSGAESVGDVIAWMRRNDIPETLIVASGRSPFGCHLYFSGVRELPDVQPNTHLRVRRQGFVHDGIRGDIKCHGHVIVAGGLHKSDSTYTVVHDRPIAPLLDWLRDWEEPAVKFAKAKTLERVTRRLGEDADNVIPQGQRHTFLLREAGNLYWLGLEAESIFTSLVDICRRYCENGHAYATEAKLRPIVDWVTSRERSVRLVRKREARKGELIVLNEPTPRQILTDWLTTRFALGEQVSIHTIVGRFNTDFPRKSAPARMTLHRAMVAANFQHVGLDLTDRRSVLWARFGEAR